jgi:hypothetical protein
MSDNPYLHRGDEWWVKPDIEIVPDCKDMEIKRLRARVAVLESDRRERIATACLAGLLADPTMDGFDLTDKAVRFADALIAQLDAEAKP